MKRKLKLQNLGCANCASKMEDKISKLDGVKSVTINFMTEKLLLEVEDDKFEKVVEESKKIISKIEPNCKLGV